jgi:hypothetical protein
VHEFSGDFAGDDFAKDAVWLAHTHCFKRRCGLTSAPPIEDGAPITSWRLNER